MVNKQVIIEELERMQTFAEVAVKALDNECNGGSGGACSTCAFKVICPCLTILTYTIKSALAKDKENKRLEGV